MAIQAIIFYLGYCVALVLHRNMGRVIYVPMLFNLWFSLMITFALLEGWDFRWLIAAQAILLFVWVLSLAQVFRNRIGLILSILLLSLAFFLGTLPDVTASLPTRAEILASSSRIWTLWMWCSLTVVLTVVVRSTIVAKFKREFVDIITNPRKRVMIPIGLYAVVLSIYPLITGHGTIQDQFVTHELNIASQILVWGWAACELPFYLLYRRLKRAQY